MSFGPTPVTLLGDTVIGTPTDKPADPVTGGSVIAQLAALNVAIDKLRYEVRETNALLLRLMINESAATDSPGQIATALTSLGSG